jgi:predicted metal-dependent hydrolase
MEQIQLGSITVDVVLKDIKNVHLSVYPPNGRVRIAAPLRMKIDTIRIYALSKLSWIKKQQQKFQLQVREAPREFLNRESHYFLGKRYLLNVIERDSIPTVVVKQSRLDLFVRPGTEFQKKQAVMEQWYRKQLKEIAQAMITKWEPIIGVSLADFTVRKMKTKWGSCQPANKRILLNLELAKKPTHCIEYIVVHELIHLLERNHNDRFVAHMDRFMPEWKELRNELNKLPVSHVDWGY